MGRRQRLEPGREYHRQLIEEVLSGESEAYEWLRDERGWRNWVINKWRLGYVKRPLAGHEAYEGRISIPYLDGLGRERHSRYVLMDRDRKPGRQKYLSMHGEDPHIFAVRYAGEPVVYVTEGEFDCIAIHECGFKAVGIPGSGAWKSWWKWCFRACEEIVIVPDPDGEKGKPGADGRLAVLPTGGQLFRFRVGLGLRGLPARVRYVDLPKGYDVNDLFIEDKRELKRRLEGGRR